MAMTLVRSTRSEVEAVLACDPVIQAANDAEALERYKRTGDRGALVVPDDATRVFVRPLSVEERIRVQDATDEIVVAMHRVERDSDEARARGLQLHRRIAWASVKLGLVRAVDGGEEYTAMEFLTCLPGELLYPAVMELAAAIERASTLDETAGKA